MKKLVITIMGLFLLLGIISQMESTEVSGFDRPMVDVTLQSVFDSENVIDIPGLSEQYGSKMVMSNDLATQQGYEFAFWVVNGVVRYDLPLDHEFRITDNINIKAFFSKSDEHVVVFMDTNGNILDTQYVSDNGKASSNKFISEGATLIEDFANYSQSSYGDGTFIGTDSIEWTYVNGYSSGKFQFKDEGYLTAIIPGGMNEIAINLEAFADNRSVDLYINNIKHTITNINKDAMVHTINDMALTGDVTLLLDNPSSSLIVNSITWKKAEYNLSTLPSKPGMVTNTSNLWNKSLDNIVDDQVIILQYEKDTTATFELTVNMGTGTGNYNFNEEVTIESMAPDFFSHWEDANGRVLSYDALYTFTMLENKNIVAVLNGVPETPQPLITISDNLSLRAGYHSHLAQFYLPDGYEIVEYGMVGTYAPFDNITLDFDGVDRYQGLKYNGRTNEFLMSFDEMLVTNPRAYLVYEHNGVMDVVYSESTVDVILEEGPEDGIGFAEVRVQDGDGGYIQTFEIYRLDQVTGGIPTTPEAATTNGYVTTYVREIDLTEYKIYVDGVYYDIDDMIPSQW